MKRLDLTGQKFGRLTVIGIHSAIAGKIKWDCICECGGSSVTATCELRGGGARSCGCIRKETTSKMRTTHGMSSSGTFNTWINMRQRCLNPENERYADWGGRGIGICERWLSFENFVNDMGEKPSRMHSIERKDNNKDYCPENCVWALPMDQGNNKRNNLRITYNGKTQTASQWCRELGLPSYLVSQRIRKYGWDGVRAITTPKGKFTQNKHHAK